MDVMSMEVARMGMAVVMGTRVVMTIMMLMVSDCGRTAMVAMAMVSW